MLQTDRLAVLVILLTTGSACLGWRRSSSHADHATGLEVIFTPSGESSVKVDGDIWLKSADTFFTVNGTRYSTGDSSLKPVEFTEGNGTDKHGAWQSYYLKYLAAGTTVVTSIRNYPDKPFVIFSQYFPDGVEGTDVGNPNHISTAFPRFFVGGQTMELGYLQYGGMMVGDTTKWMDKWNSQTMNLRDGIPGGPLVLFDHQDNVILISSYNEFMSSVSQHDGLFGGKFGWGVMGSARAIPVGYTLEIILYYSDQGVNEAFEGWGDVMRHEYGRHDSFVQADLINNYLGYWMDNGSYYYYNTVKGMNYEETILAVQKYAQSLGIPYRYIQYDSWWYFEGPLLGITRWEGRPDVFPHGMQYVYNKTGWPVIAHNRWWSSLTPYAKKNGGRFDFVVEALKAAPLNADFWEYLFTTSKTWGLITYEQDWLNVELIGMNAFKEDITLGRRWLMEMGRAAEKTGITLQYCMSNPRHALQALEIPVVTQARVTDDYSPGKDNWKMGLTSIFAHALRIAPYKDTFWTTRNQPGNPYGQEEYFPALNALASVLSTGPVGPGDAIGKTNKTLLMRCCNADGLILKPFRPATAIDSQIYQSAFRDGSGPQGEVWTTYSEVSGYIFGIILAADMTPLTVYNIDPYKANFRQNFLPSKVYRDDLSAPQPAVPFSEDTPLVLSGCSAADFCLYHTTPILQYRGKELLLYGERWKWVPMSAKRVRNISVSDHDVQVTLHGAPGEQVNFTFSLDGQPLTVTCTFPPSGVSTINLQNNTCLPY